MNRKPIRITVILCLLLMSISVVSALTGELTIITIPDGADILIDGKEMGKTPLKMDDLSVGVHDVLAKKQGYDDLNKQVRVTALPRTMTWTLVSSVTKRMTNQDTETTMDEENPTQKSELITNKKPNSGSDLVVPVEIKSIPEGAIISIDGIPIGKNTNAVVDVRPGDLLVSLDLRNYERYSEEIRFPDESPVLVHLIPAKTGKMWVRTTPDDVDVYLDGEFLGTGPRVYKDNIPYGVHSLQGKSFGYQTVTKKVDFNPDHNDLEIKLENMQAILTINTIPTGAHISYDGKSVEKTTPVSLKLPPGEHTIKAYIDGYPPKSQDIVLEAGYQDLMEFILEGPKGEEIPMGSLVQVGIDTDPQGASITIDNYESLLKTPSFFVTLPGDHLIELSLPSYETYREEISFPEENPLIIKLKKQGSNSASIIQDESQNSNKKADLSISTIPSGAKVVVSGEKGTKTGKSPHVLTIPTGSYSITITHDGYETYQSNVVLDTNGKNLEISLVPTSETSISNPDLSTEPSDEDVLLCSTLIDSTPRGATVTIDNQIAGETPLTLSDYGPGQYSCTVSLPGYESRDYLIDVTSKWDMYYRVDLETGEWMFTKLV